ncbi:hypothetical protein P43SY_002083 [Pythium insidiosum]|uniref:TKL protein kinase n=1 Tax=Pythium insidiosum TaxID=114742 RepID=A0AAD5QE75_PYTIN|nr:hypothetical protein P43SY_002083 [Pythium insidiosum]
MSASEFANAVCTRVDRNTLTTNCFSACGSKFPLCVNYAARPSNESLKEGDGNYYYQGCAYTKMKTCVSEVGPNACELQCLQAKNEKNEEWIMDVAPPQADRAETSLFLYVDKLKLPPSLRHLKIVGTTELTRKVPLAFASDAFASGSGLQNMTILDVSVESINNNIFPTNLTRLVIQRTQLKVFEPLGNRRLPELRSLDLSENSLEAIPPVVFELESLKELHLQHNSIKDAYLTSSQVSFLRKLDVLDLKVSDDPAENCETALNVTPVIAQLRHPQLLSVLGLMWEDMHTMSVVSEFMNRGTLEEFLLAPDNGLTWRNFKKKAAHDITYDPSMRPSAQYVTAMLQHLP